MKKDISVIKNSKQFERIFRSIQQCKTTSDVESKLNSIDQDESTNSLYDELGIDLFKIFTSMQKSTTVSNFDRKLLRQSALLAHYDIDYALKFFEYYREAAKNKSVSWIRCQRIENALINTKHHIEQHKKQNRKIVTIHPYLEQNLPNNKFNSIEEFKEKSTEMFEPCLVTISKNTSPQNKTVYRLSTADDYDLFDKKCIAELNVRNTLTYKYLALKNVCVSCEPSGIIFKDKGEYKYLYSANGIYHHFRICGKTVLKDNPLKLDEAFMIPRKGENNYFHSVIDVLPNYLAYKILDLDCPIVISHKLSEIDKVVIKKLKIPLNRIIETEKNGVEVTSALVPMSVSFLDDFIRMMREYSIKKCAGKYPLISNKKKIYISRIKSGTRTMINEDKVEEVMKSAAFEIVYMEEHTLEEQMAIMSSADLIVGPHGAGLTNMVYANSGSKILELIPSRYLTPMFRQLAVNCGHKYGVIIGETHSGSTSDKGEFLWSIDIEKLKIVLKEL